MRFNLLKFLSSLLLLSLIMLPFSCKKDSENSNPSTDKLPVFTYPSSGPVSDITASSAHFAVTISGNSGVAITARGVVWNISPTPTITLSTKTTDGIGMGSFVATLSGLAPNTKYYVRAYATIANGTSYGSEFSFTTQSGGGNPGTVTDIDGNTYQTVTIGTQVWMKENLRSSKYRNGDTIPTGLSNSQWGYTTSGAFAIYDTTYGKLYNWYAVADPRGLCPAGWHVPTDGEWITLENFLGGASVAGGKMKAVSSLWNPPNSGATDESGFSGLPGGTRLMDGSYYGIGYSGWWWTSSEVLTTNAWYRVLGYSFGNSNRYDYDGKQSGFSVRCLRD